MIARHASPRPLAMTSTPKAHGPRLAAVLLCAALGASGTAMHQLTRPSALVLEHGWEAYHVSPSWSPDGRTVSPSSDIRTPSAH